jgi:GcrA cell cycle regulator
VTLYGEDDLARIAELWAQQLSTAEIGRELELPKNSVCRLARNARLRGDPRFPERRFERSEPKPRQIGKSKAPPAPVLVPLIAPSPPKRGPFRVFELEPHHCRYPVFSGQTRGDHRFCGEPRRHNSAYCDKHDALCNTGLFARAKRA